ncbi:MAG: VanW family protein [Bacillota bacterium]
MSDVRVRYKRLRILMDDIYSILRGWYFRLASGKADKEDYSGWRVISDFSTAIRWREGLGEINQNRIENMKLCCQMISGLIMKPGQVFSLRRLIGEPGLDKGFRDGPVIVRGKLKMSSGGGLCQVSTTIFNAALAANLKILQKHNHSTDLWGENRFIELGRDAVYVFARKDIKFKNNHGSSIIILMDVDEKNLRLNCRILSQKVLCCTVHVESRVLDELIPAGARKNGESGQLDYKKGWLVLTKRYVIDTKGKKKINYLKKEKYKPVLVKEQGD